MSTLYVSNIAVSVQLACPAHVYNLRRHFRNTLSNGPSARHEVSISFKMAPEAKMLADPKLVVDLEHICTMRILLQMGCVRDPNLLLRRAAQGTLSRTYKLVRLMIGGASSAGCLHVSSFKPEFCSDRAPHSSEKLCVGLLRLRGLAARDCQLESAEGQRGFFLPRVW